MKCPYLKTLMITTLQVTSSEPESPTKLIETQIQQDIHGECLMEDCGAWQLDHCCYSGGEDKS